ncbi:MAG TPA: farnesyl diphosphate synthase [Gemmatimonadaceae bacterium]|nr:farnesyl diphosphate synthase [Gemmatimonadaceae bacterium]
MLPLELRASVESALPRSVEPRLSVIPNGIAAPIRYSLEAGGKRVRGMLVLAAYRAAGGRGDASGLAAAIEIIHAYSLLHDDLPCMDDDDVRRGQPTAHRVFGVPAAMIAGAAMIPIAARVAYDSARALKLPGDTCCTIVKVLMRAAGAGGMIGGQMLDLEAEGEANALTRPDLDAIHSAKTGALITASLEIGGLAAQTSSENLNALTRYGSRIGLAFQIMDDVLDLTSSTDRMGKITGRDVALGKSTYPGLLGVNDATAGAGRLVREACDDLSEHGLLSSELREIAGFIVSRNH